jgi:two-component system, OmpR family, phosphate regulon sensor histidine kinase PhoR
MARHEHSPKEVAKSAFGAIAVLAILNASWAAVGALAALWKGFPKTSLGWLLTDAAVFSIGIALAGLAIGFIGRLLSRRSLDFFEQMIEAIRRVSRGDFSVRIAWNEGGRQGLFRDVIDRFNEMAISLARMEELRQEFVCDVSHEIQSPLTSIRGFALALRDPALARGAAEHYLDIIVAESDRLSRLASSLLSLNALEGRKPEVREYRLDHQLRDQLLAAEPLWRDKGIAVDLEAAELSIAADSLLLSQVWTNLLSNAIKFTPRGGRITVSLRQEDGMALVGFEDTGIGMKEEECLRAFDRFYMADSSRSASGGGNGLGLAIARKIVGLHSGSIEASSPGPGGGSRFALRLPLKPPHPAPESPIRERTSIPPRKR